MYDSRYLSLCQHYRVLLVDVRVHHIEMGGIAVTRVTNNRGNIMTISFNLFELKQRLQSHLKEEVSLAQIARDSELHRNTVERIFNNKTDRIDLETLGKLLLYFQSQGLEVQTGDLFVTEKE
jgi:hypothetical protein